MSRLTRTQFQVMPPDTEQIWVVYNEMINQLNAGMLTIWRGEFSADNTPYYKGDQVLENGFLGIANTEVYTGPAPILIGDASWKYEGTLTPDSIETNQILLGQRYSFIGDIYVDAIRVEMVLGFRYSVYLITDPEGVPKWSELLEYTAEISGWHIFNISPQLVAQGTTFDLLVQVTEADPIPVTVTANYNYTTPNNDTAPASGQIVHANKTLDTIHVSYTDDDSTDRTTLLQGLANGDRIVGAGMTWVINQSQDQGTYITFTVIPSQQGAPDGVQAFDFDTIVDIPTFYGYETDYFLADPQVQGLFSATGDYDSIVPDENAWGVDLLYQPAIINQNWDLQAVSKTATGSGSTPELNPTVSQMHWLLWWDRWLDSEKENIALAVACKKWKPGPKPAELDCFRVQQFMGHVNRFLLDLSDPFIVETVEWFEAEEIIGPGRASILLLY